MTILPCLHIWTQISTALLIAAAPCKLSLAPLTISTCFLLHVYKIEASCECSYCHHIPDAQSQVLSGSLFSSLLVYVPLNTRRWAKTHVVACNSRATLLPRHSVRGIHKLTGGLVRLTCFSDVLLKKTVCERQVCAGAQVGGVGAAFLKVQYRPTRSTGHAFAAQLGRSH